MLMKTYESSLIKPTKCRFYEKYITYYELLSNPMKKNLLIRPAQDIFKKHSWCNV